MTLDEAINKVLLKSENGLTAGQIADKINLQSIYTRRDGLPVSAMQVVSRASMQKDIFYVEGKVIRLKENNFELKQEKIIHELVDSLTQHISRRVRGEYFEYFDFILHLLIDFELKNVNGNIKLEDFETTVLTFLRANQIELTGFNSIRKRYFLNVILELIHEINKHPNWIGLFSKMYDWLSDYELPKYLHVPRYLTKILGSSNLFDEASAIVTSPNQNPVFLLPILEKRPELMRHLKYQGIGFDRETLEIHFRLIQLLSNRLKPEDASNNNKKQIIGVFNPEWNSRRKDYNWPSELDMLRDQVAHQVSEFKMDKAFVVVPEGILTSLGRKALNSKSILTDSNYLDAVITVPFLHPNIGIKSVALLIFDFHKKDDKVYMANFNEIKDFNIETSWQVVTDHLNQKLKEEKVSCLPTIEQIRENKYNWHPNKYLNEKLVLEIKPKPGYKLYTLKELIFHKQRGKNIHPSLRYPGGEIKYIRTRELSEDGGYLQLNKASIGVDHDQIKGNQPLLMQGLLVSLIGNKLKPTLLKVENPVLLGNNIVALQVKDNLVLPEYLVAELGEQYVLDQLDMLRTGSVIKHLRMTDLLSIKVQVPVLIEDQVLKIHQQMKTLESESITDSKEAKNELHTFIGTIKHTLKQPLATIENDINSLDRYLQKKVSEGVLKMDELTVPLMEGQDAQDFVQQSLVNTLKRSKDAIKEAHWRLKQSESLMRISTMEKKEVARGLKSYLKDRMKSYPEINCTISGENFEVLMDESMLNILIDNLVDNANKFGFKNMQDKQIHFRISRVFGEEGNDEILLIYFNNGEPLPKDFDTARFIQDGATSNRLTGEGFGGHLISKIMQRHGGRTEVFPANKIGNPAYNFRINFYFPSL